MESEFCHCSLFLSGFLRIDSICFWFGTIILGISKGIIASFYYHFDMTLPVSAPSLSYSSIGIDSSPSESSNDNDNKNNNEMSNQNPLVNSEEPNDNKTNNVPTTPPPPPTYPTGPRQNLTLLATSLSIFLVSLDSTLLSTTIPSILNTFHHLSHTTWYTTSYMLGMATTQAFWGKAYSNWSLKSTFLISSIIFSTGAGICAVAPNSEVFILGRVVGGFGGAGVAAGTFLIVACTAPVEKRPVRLGVVSLWFVVAAVVGPLAGGVLATKVSWRAGFYGE